MAGATALGSVMGLTFTGAYFAGGMAQAAVVGSPGYEPTVRAYVQKSDPARTYRMGGLEIGAFTDGQDAPSALGGFSALADTRPQAPTSVGDAASKRQAFAQTYNIAENAGFPATERPQFSLRKSERELDCLTTALYFEARGEGDAGMAAVAQVIVNRAQHPDFPKTLCGVIYQGAGKGRGCQFSFACDGSMRQRRQAALWDRAREIAERAMEEPVSKTVGTATFFHATRISPNWRGLTRVATVGRHVFYRHAGFRGSAANFLRGRINAVGGTVELASAMSASTNAAATVPTVSKRAVYKVAATAGKADKALPMVTAGVTAEPEAASAVRIADAQPEVAAAAEAQAVEAVSLDALTDAAAATTS
jgi:spore germination cell wall hydrolase CwlJ-like protein